MNGANLAIAFIIAASVSFSSPSVSAQQAPGTGPLRGEPHPDDRGKRILKPPPEQRGPFARLMVGCVFYEEADYRGRSTEYRQLLGVKPGNHVDDAAYVGDAMNDRFSSFRCVTPCRAVLYTEANFRGDASHASSQAPDMRTVSGPTRSGFNDVVSSLKVICRVF
ncbi:MAG: hypothetical protein DI629_13085 [Mesorhizobium amorphae]|nr:MAG: hypothetical protein DI629_13085 [Mesorhizobium amorphae]